MSEKKDIETQSERKIEEANRIAHQSRKTTNSYQHIENAALRAIRLFSTFLDRSLLNPKYTKVVSLLLAVAIYFFVSYVNGTGAFSSALTNSRELEGVAVTAKYNSDTFEITGLPETADITITGDGSAVTTAVSSGGVIVADLEGMTEGEHNIRLEASGFGDNVNIKIDPSNAVITLAKKKTQSFEVTTEYINRDKMDSVYSVGEPVLSADHVNVRASDAVLQNIAFVRALIDVSGQTQDFQTECKLIAYDSGGQPVKADIFPSTITASVPVTSPHKTVPIEVQVSGDLPEGLAISSIQMDQQSVTIYAPEETLATIDNVVVSLNVSTITKDSTIMRPIALPAGVNTMNINQITLTVTLAESTSRVIEDVPITFRSNTNNYRASQPDNITTVDVTVSGAEDNIKDITSEDIVVYVDMANAVPGTQDFELQVVQPTSGLVKYTIADPSYTLNIIGDTTQDTDGGGTPAPDSNNG